MRFVFCSVSDNGVWHLIACGSCRRGRCNAHQIQSGLVLCLLGNGHRQTGLLFVSEFLPLDVALLVFDHVVRTNEAMPAKPAAEFLLASVSSPVTGQLIRAGKSPVAVLYWTLIRLLSCVDTVMSLEVRPLQVALVASLKVADKRPLTVIH